MSVDVAVESPVPLSRRFAFIAACAMALGVALGAFGAHGLKAHVSVDRLAVFETGVRYHLFHALGLFAVAWAVDRWPQAGMIRAAGWVQIAGMAVFSGSLYLLVLTDTPWLGAVTPFGGTALIAGWCLLAAGLWRAGTA